MTEKTKKNLRNNGTTPSDLYQLAAVRFGIDKDYAGRIWRGEHVNADVFRFMNGKTIKYKKISDSYRHMFSENRGSIKKCAEVMEISYMSLYKYAIDDGEIELGEAELVSIWWRHEIQKQAEEKALKEASK